VDFEVSRRSQDWAVEVKIGRGDKPSGLGGVASEITAVHCVIS
jgi:hypothetical protein